ncbi:MAG: calcium-binding protein [Minicystis sp.]
MARSLISVTRIFIALGALAIGAGCGSSSGGGNGGGGSGGSGGGNAGEACTVAGSFQACDLPGDAEGQPSGGQQCVADADGNLAWSECKPASTAASTPLVLSFDGAPVEMTASVGAFDVDGTMSVVTDWPTATTPWLALDRDGNGAIDDGGELFGSATILGSGARAANGFAALAELDSNGDGRITPADAAWASLRLWSDRDGDRRSGAGELGGLDARGVVSIDLAYTSLRRCDARQNCEIERASFRWVDAAGVEHTGAIVDVHLKHQ